MLLNLKILVFYGKVASIPECPKLWHFRSVLFILIEPASLNSR